MSKKAKQAKTIKFEKYNNLDKMNFNDNIIKKFKEHNYELTIDHNKYEVIIKDTKLDNNFITLKFAPIVELYTFIEYPRSSKKTFKALQHLMLDQEFHIGLIEPKLASIAAKHENILDSKKRRVLFDFDKSEDHDLILHLDQFEKDIKNIDNDIELLFIRTPNGFSVIPNKRFDTRELLKKYPNVEVKRDDSYCFNYKYNV